MKRVEISYNSNLKELDKLNARLERAEKNYAKKLAAAQKWGVADMDGEQHGAWLNTCPTNEGFLTNKEDVKKNGAWFDLIRAEEDLADIKYRIEKTVERVEKVEKEVEAYHEELNAIEDLKQKESLLAAEFEEEQKEWAKDGITLESRYHGKTPSGKWFSIISNNGYTERSLHCFSLYLEGQGCVFTSGEFWRAYGIIRNS